MVVCTKLVRWMVVAAVFMELWYAAMTGWLPVTLSPQLYQALMPVSRSVFWAISNLHVVLNLLQMPLYAIMLFGVSEATVLKLVFQLIV